MLQNLNSANTHVELLKAVEEKLLVLMVNMKWCTMTYIVLKHWDEGYCVIMSETGVSLSRFGKTGIRIYKQMTKAH